MSLSAFLPSFLKFYTLASSSILLPCFVLIPTQTLKGVCVCVCRNTEKRKGIVAIVEYDHDGEHRPETIKRIYVL